VAADQKAQLQSAETELRITAPTQDVLPLSQTATDADLTILMSVIHEKCATRRSISAPEAPAAKLGLAHSARRNDASPHRFYNREARYTLMVEGAAWAGDRAATCQNLSHNGHEFGLPSLHQFERFPRWGLTGSSISGFRFSVAHSHGHTE
jgi:hypothetical protein